MGHHGAAAGELGELRPVRTLFLASTIGAVAFAVLSVGLLAGTLDVGRLRDFDILNFMRSVLEASDVNVLSVLPRVVNQPFELNAPGALVAFLGLGLATMLLLFWALAGVGAPVVAVMYHTCPGGAERRLGNWFWAKAYPLGVIVGFASPGVLLAVRHLMRGAGGATYVAVTLLIAAASWIGLLGILRDASRIRLFVRLSWLASLAVVSAVWGGAAVAAALVHRPVQPPASAGLPNILLVSIDSLRHDHLHCYGYARQTSPTIDALAREGVLFRTVVSPTSWTLPAHLTLLTSLPPEAHGAVDDGLRLRDNARFLAEVLWQAGYTTAGFVSAPYLDAAYGFSQGFDHYDDYTVAKMSQRRAHQGVTSPALLTIVSRWLANWEAGGRRRPFFIFMHMWDVHYDYAPPPPYDSMFDPDYRGTVTSDDYEYGEQVHPDMDPRDLQHIIALYDGEIRFTDSYLGLALDRLRALRVLDNTIIVVTADHGDEFFEHGHKGHGKALYDETVLVPLVIRFPPRVPKNRGVDGQVRLMDVAPTILSLAGLSQPAEFGALGSPGPQAAQSLTPWMAGDGSTAPPALTAFGDLQVSDAPKPIASIRTGPFKLITQLRGHGGEELYDLVADPGEQTNLSRPDHSVATPLRQELAAWRKAWQGGRWLAQKVQLSDDQEERLRALGYMK
jgi:arylsulfatase A-like enzyme